MTDAGQASPPFLRTRLAAMMFLQFAVLGSWAPVLGQHLRSLGLLDLEIGAVYSTGALAIIVTALVAGEIADRWLAIEKLLAICFAANALFLFLAGRVSGNDPARLAKLLGFMFAGSLFFGPTPALATAISFHHLRDVRKDFAIVRVLGTIGWIAAGVVLGAWMWLTGRRIGDCLNQGALFAAITAAYCATLPHTPPRRDPASRFAVGQAIGMLRRPSFALFTCLAFVLALFSTFAYYRAGEFYKAIGVEERHLSTVLTVGQISEIVAMLCLPWLYGRLGVKGTIALGLASWIVRYGLMALGKPLPLMIAAQGLHGFCFTFASVAGQLYVERVCPPGVRASAQSFHSLVTAGLGMFAGGYVGGWVLEGVGQGGTPRWTSFWAVSTIGCVAILVVFLATFRARDPVSPPPAIGRA